LILVFPFLSDVGEGQGKIEPGGREERTKREKKNIADRFATMGEHFYVSLLITIDFILIRSIMWKGNYMTWGSF
jgi:hypothetical protein